MCEYFCQPLYVCACKHVNLCRRPHTRIHIYMWTNMCTFTCRQHVTQGQSCDFFFFQSIPVSGWNLQQPASSLCCSQPPRRKVISVRGSLRERVCIYVCTSVSDWEKGSGSFSGSYCVTPKDCFAFSLGFTVLEQLRQRESKERLGKIVDLRTRRRIKKANWGLTQNSKNETEDS